MTMSPGPAASRSSPALKVKVSLDDHPGLVIGLAVHPRPMAGPALVDDQRDGGAMVLAFEVSPLVRVPFLISGMVPTSRVDRVVDGSQRCPSGSPAWTPTQSVPDAG
jgi:hypothetical protein